MIVFDVVGRSTLLSLPLAVRPGSIGLGFMVHSLGADDHTIAKMAQQVKDVLPHIPLNVITKDLGRIHVLCTVSKQIWVLCHFLCTSKVISWLLTAKTNCVDTTITNLLENKEESSMEATGMSTFGSKLSSYSSGSASTIKVGTPFCGVWALPMTYLFLGLIFWKNKVQITLDVEMWEFRLPNTLCYHSVPQFVFYTSILFPLLYSLLPNVLGNHQLTDTCLCKREKKLYIILQEGGIYFLSLCTLSCSQTSEGCHLLDSIIQFYIMLKVKIHLSLFWNL